MNVNSNGLVRDLLGASVGVGVLGLCYSAVYKLDQKITVPFFIFGLIFARVTAEFGIVRANKVLCGREFKDLPRTDAFEIARIHSLNILAQTSILTIALIVGRQLGIFETKATVFISIAVVALLATCGFVYLGAKAQPENPAHLK